MKRFLRKPNTVSNDEIKLLQSYIPIKKIWEDKYAHTREFVSYWLKHNPNRKNIRHAKADMAGNPPYGGQLGIKYQEVSSIVNRSDDDWVSFIKPKSDGLTKLGQKLLQQAIESYVYCVLGAQARTRWAIVNRGAKSLQTQDVFQKLVRDTIAEDDVTVSISNMRQAIADTNVVLNMAITPGLVLVPSDMIIIKKKIPGWNNILTLATGNMNLGFNSDVNKVTVSRHECTTSTSTSKHESANSRPVSKHEPTVSRPVSKHEPTVIRLVSTTPTPGGSKGTNTIVFIATGVIISLITRYTVKLL